LFFFFFFFFAVGGTLFSSNVSSTPSAASLRLSSFKMTNFPLVSGTSGVYLARG